jgi:hypothetical protein
MPKRVRDKFYVHRLYSDLVIPTQRLELFKKIANEELGLFQWNTLRVLTGYRSVAFQLSNDFDTADEPTVDQTINVDLIEMRITITNTPNTIWHHKWQWVEPDYKGFDYYKSKARSELWKPFVKTNELSKIGNKTYWNSIKTRWEKQP